MSASISDTALIIAGCATAGGTLVLAAVTAWMASSTKNAAEATTKAAQQAGRAADAAEQDLQQGQHLLEIGQAQLTAAQEQAKASLETLAAASRPILVPATGSEAIGTEKVRYATEDETSKQVSPIPIAAWWREPEVHRSWVVVRIRNVGTGPAIIGRQPTDVVLVTMYGPRTFGWSSTLVVAPGDCIDLAFCDARTPEEDGGCLAAMFDQTGSSPYVVTGTTVTVVIRYTDIAGTAMPSSHLRYKLRAEGLIEQRLVELGDEVSPP